ncbi:MAG: DUF3887 domain-containing protein [Acidimicrobiales bacterium]|jgi:hypothetical protein
MTSRAEREVMGLMLTTNAELVASVLRGGEDSEGDSVVTAIATTRSLGRIVEDTMHALVQQARAEGHTWAEIGELLHVTRQAAFQRFGTTSTSDTVPAEDIPPLEGAEDRAMRIFTAFVERRFEQARTDFSARMREAGSPQLLTSARTKMERRYGAFLEFGTPLTSVRHGCTVVDVPVAFDRGDLVGRCSFNVDGEVAGFVFVDPDAP